MTNKYIPQRRSMCYFHGTSEPATHGKEMLENGSDVDGAKNDGWTPLMPVGMGILL